MLFVFEKNVFKIFYLKSYVYAVGNSNDNDLDKESFYHDGSPVSDISSDEEELYHPSDSSSSSNEVEESANDFSPQFSRNGKSWTTLLSARAVLTNASNIVPAKSEVNAAL